MRNIANPRNLVDNVLEHILLEEPPQTSVQRVKRQKAAKGGVLDFGCSY